MMVVVVGWGGVCLGDKKCSEKFGHYQKSTAGVDNFIVSNEMVLQDVLCED